MAGFIAVRIDFEDYAVGQADPARSRLDRGSSRAQPQVGGAQMTEGRISGTGHVASQQ